MRRPAWILTLARASAVAALLLAAPARAQHLDPRDDAFSSSPPIGQRVHFALDFQGVPGCNEPGLFMDAMRFHFWSIHLWWEPFAHVSPAWPLKVRVSPHLGWFAGTSVLERPKGVAGRPFHEDMRGPLSCYNVLSGLASKISTEIMLMYPAPEKPTLACEAKPEIPCDSRDSRFSVWPTEWPLPPLEKPKPDPPKPLERWPVVVRLGVTASPELIAVGWGSLGLSAEIGARYHAVSIGVEAHGDPPLGSDVYPIGAVSFARLSGALLVCGHWGWFAGCGLGDVGRFFFTDRAGGALPASILYGAAGVRASLEFPIAPPRVFFRVGLDMRAPIHPASYKQHSVSLFEVAGPSVGLGLGLLTELPL